MLEDLVVTLNEGTSFPCETTAGPDPENITREMCMVHRYTPGKEQLSPIATVSADHFRPVRSEQQKQGLKEGHLRPWAVASSETLHGLDTALCSHACLIHISGKRVSYALPAK